MFERSRAAWDAFWRAGPGENLRQSILTRSEKADVPLDLYQELQKFSDNPDALLEEFSADILNISLLDCEIKAGEKTPLFNVDSEDPEFKQFLPHLEKGETVCGRLNRNKLDFLFRHRAQWVESSALVPVGDQGLIAIGSSDPARFYPGMGTLFLDLLAKVVLRKLELSKPARKRRSA